MPLSPIGNECCEFESRLMLEGISYTGYDKTKGFKSWFWHEGMFKAISYLPNPYRKFLGIRRFCGFSWRVTKKL